MDDTTLLKGTFCYDEYKLILKSLKNKNTTFEDALQGEFNILRHDVEFNVDRAHKMGSIDKEFGIKSTFFVQVISYSSPMLVEILCSRPSPWTIRA